MMNHDEIDRILAQRDEIVPSSGFTAAVMDAVRREASVPPPIPFPWKRALPCVVLAGAAVLYMIGAVASMLTHPHAALPAGSPPTWWSVAGKTGTVAALPGANWIALALIVSIATVGLSLMLSFRGVSRSVAL
jgi:hypothetical protein